MNSTSLDPMVLGRILLLQSGVEAAPDERRLAEMVAHTLAGLPGVAGCLVCVEGSFSAAPATLGLPDRCRMTLAHGGTPKDCPACDPLWSDAEGWNCTLQAGQGRYGAIHVRAGDREALRPYEPFLVNTANLVALQILNHRQAQALQSLNRNLEQQVAQRTAALRDSMDAVLEKEKILSQAQRLAHVGGWTYEALGDQFIPTEEWCRIHGISAASLHMAELLPLAHPADLPAVRAAFDQTLAVGEPYEIVHRVIRQNDGELRYVSAQGEAVKGPDGTVVRLFGAAQDITERKLAEQQLREALRQQTALLKEIHHRVKNNLQVMNSLISLQSRQIRNPAVLAALRDTQARLRAMALLHETLYCSGRVDHVDCGPYVDRLCGWLAQAFDLSRRRIELGSRVHPPGLALAVDQAVPCGLILNELVTNACKHAFPGERTGAISVEMSEAADGGICVRVSDDGVGLPETVEVENSTTLGLDLVDGLTRQLGGRLTLNRTRGTCLEICFNPREGAESTP